VSLGLLIGISLVLGLAAWLGFLWSVRSGQYDDPEGPKYRMLDDDADDAVHPRRREKPGRHEKV
jgi:cbb3-type cytochrome oxidase maturation protein